jgi:hypothetical protein
MGVHPRNFQCRVQVLLPDVEDGSLFAPRPKIGDAHRDPAYDRLATLLGPRHDQELGHVPANLSFLKTLLLAFCSRNQFDWLGVVILFCIHYLF